MEQKIITTGNSAKSYKWAGFATLPIYTIAGILILFIFGEPDIQVMSYLGVLLCVFFIVLGFAAFFKGLMQSYTYLNIYPDRFEGVGLKGIIKESFNLKNAHIVGVSVENKIIITLNTVSGVYKIYTNKKLAEDILAYCNRTLV